MENHGGMRKAPDTVTRAL